MLPNLRRRLTYANVMATVAVFISLGGSSYAALRITSKDVPKNALTGADIKNLTGADVTNESLTSADVKNISGRDVVDGSLLAEDFGGQLPAGPQGPQGPQGPAGSAAQFTGATAGGDLSGTYPNPSIAPDAVTGAKVADDSVFSADIADDTLAGGGLAIQDLASNSVGQSEIQTDAVAASEIANDSIDSGEIVDFGLSNQDVGVLFAEVNAAATLANSSGNVTVVRVGAVGAGTYEVDFARNITSCAAVATIGPAGGGSAAGQVNVADRGGNVEAVFVDTNNSAGTAADLPFRLVVVC